MAAPTKTIYKPQVLRLLETADIWEEVPGSLDEFFLGFAAPGTTGTDQATWAICHISAAVDGVQSRQWAEGTPWKYNQVWDNRATLTYSWPI